MTATSHVKACVAEIQGCTSRNYLKLNGGKSELLVFHTKHSPRPVISYIMVDKEGITPTASCRSTGVMFDDTLTFETHQSCLQDFILALEVHLEDSHLPGKVIIGNSDPCRHYKQTGLL